MAELKQFILDFKGFVNENLSEETVEVDTPTEVPQEVTRIAAGIINGNFEGHRILGSEGDTIRVRLSDQDFQYMPDTLTLRDFGFETWSGKPFDVNLKMSNADPATKEVEYTIEYKPKEARRAKVETDEEPEFVDSYENEPNDEFEDVPEPDENPEALAAADKELASEFPVGDEEDETVFEGRKKKAAGGFPNIKVKEVKPQPKKPADKKPAPGFKPGAKADLMKKDSKKMAETTPPKNTKEEKKGPFGK